MRIVDVDSSWEFCFVSEELFMSKGYCIYPSLLFKDNSTPAKVWMSIKTLSYIKR